DLHQSPGTCRTRAIGSAGSGDLGLVTHERFTAAQPVARESVMVVTPPIVDPLDSGADGYFAFHPPSANTEAMSFQLLCSGMGVDDALLRYRFDIEFEDFWEWGKN